MRTKTQTRMPEDDIHIGPAGWSYKDWDGIVYPARLKREKHPLEYLAQFFDLVEINTSFYGHIKPEWGKLWCRKVSANPRFLFTAKLNKAFTHSPSAVVESTSAATIQPQPEDEQLAKEGFDSIGAEGRLGALLIQFPISFRNNSENRDYVSDLLGRFRQYPRVVEVRHASWNNEGTLRYFAEKGAAFCNIDQPLLGRALTPTEYVTSDIGYVRLHGRNYDQWFEAERPHDRYDYLYPEDELERWKQRIQHVAGKAKTTFVVTNNHFQGKAVANGLELKNMLTGEKVRVPEGLPAHYPRLRDIMA